MFPFFKKGTTLLHLSSSGKTHMENTKLLSMSVAQEVLNITVL